MIHLPVSPHSSRVAVLHMAFRLLLISLIVTISTDTASQHMTLEYTMRRKTDVVGHLRVTRNVSGSSTMFSLESFVDARLIVPILANTREESVFEDGIMTRSVLYREMNGRQRANKTTTRIDGHYLVQTGRRTETLALSPIHHNIMSLYFAEPAYLTQVYSDGFQQFCPVEKISHNHYRVRFPNREQTDFLYENGICVKLHVQHALGTVIADLKGR